MKKNKSVRKDDLSSVNSGSKRVYKMYKSKKNWVVAPIVLATLVGAIGTAPVSVLGGYVAQAAMYTTDTLATTKDSLTKLVNELPTSTSVTAKAKTDLVKKIADATAFDTNDSVVTSINDLLAASTTDTFTTYSNLQTAVTNQKDGAELTSGQKDEFQTTLAKAVVSTFDTTKTLTVSSSSAGNLYANNINDVYAPALKAFNQKIKDATAILNQVSADIKTAEAQSLDAYKSDATTKVKANGFLNETEVNKYTTQISLVKVDDTVTAAKTAIDTVVGSAKAASDQNKLDMIGTSTTGFTKTLADAVSANSLSTADQTSYLARANDAENTKALQAVIDEATAKISATKDLTTLRTTIQNKINNTVAILGNDAQKLQNKLNAATTLAQLQAVQTEVEAAIVAKTDVETYRGQAITFVTNSLPNLTASEKQTALAQLAQKTIYTTNDAIKAIVDQATAQDATNLKTAKATATAAIASYNYLSDTAKKTSLQTIANATLVSSIVGEQTTQKNNNEVAEFNAYKTAAKAKVSGLSYLNDAQKSDFNSAATGIDGITLATGELAKAKKAVDDIVASANTANIAAGIAKDDVAGAKKAFAEGVNGLNLSDAAKQGALTAVAKLDNTKDIQDLYATYKAQSDANDNDAKTAADLKIAQADAIKAINEMGYLSVSEKSDAIAKVNAATKQSDVGTALNVAIANNSSNQAFAAQLQNYKNNTVSTINNLSVLTLAQKAPYIANVNAQTTVAGINKVQTDAVKADFDGQSFTDDQLSMAKNAAGFVVSKFALLTTDQQIAFSTDINAAKSVTEVKALVAKAYGDSANLSDAKVVDAINGFLKDGNYNVAKDLLANLVDASTKATYTAKVNDAIALRDAKIAANTAINNAAYLSATEKADYTDKVAKADTVSAVNAISKEVADKAPAENVQMYRAYNPNSGEHLYTIDKAEFDRAVAAGWANEGNAWVAASKGTPVYRLYNPNSGEHFYTVDTTEYNKVAAAGWTKEGVVFYSADSKAVNVYRLFNPNATGAGSHHFTTDAKEVATLVQAGWKSENIAFFGL